MNAQQLCAYRANNLGPYGVVDIPLSISDASMPVFATVCGPWPSHENRLRLREILTFVLLFGGTTSNEREAHAQERLMEKPNRVFHEIMQSAAVLPDAVSGTLIRFDRAPTAKGRQWFSPAEGVPVSEVEMFKQSIAVTREVLMHVGQISPDLASRAHEVIVQLDIPMVKTLPIAFP